MIDPTDAKEIRESHFDKAPEKFFVFNKKLCSKDSVERIYEEQIFKIKKLTLEGNWIFLTSFFGINLKENQSVEKVISNQWNFKPLLSLSEDIDFQKVQQFEQYTFQIYTSILDSYVKFKSKQSWCAKAIEEIQMQEVWANILSRYVFNINKTGDTEATKELIKKLKSSIRSFKEILIQLEQANIVNKTTPLHKAFLMDKWKFLADIYISQEEMFLEIEEDKS